MIFSKPALVTFNTNPLSDHSRDPVGIDITRISSQKRTANGTMRQHFTADKRQFSLSWTDLPHSSVYTVDGFWGAEDIETVYENHPGSFTLVLKYDSVRIETFTVLFASFSKTPKKRGRFTFYDIQCTLEEV